MSVEFTTILAVLVFLGVPVSCSSSWGKWKRQNGTVPLTPAAVLLLYLPYGCDSTCACKVSVLCAWLAAELVLS